ncbi:MAG: DNA polymerase II, partial [Thermoanaerobaculia bacterium]|nr:DNA polymerase II [Thermoanaerobaculia bacterium]
GRPVVHLFGVLESGGSFLVRDTRFAPHFWIRSTDAERGLEIGARNQQPSSRTTMAGEALVRVELPRPSDAPPLRDRLRDKGIQPCEADVPFAIRYLIEHGIRGTLEIEGRSRKGKRIDRVFEDPILRPCRWRPSLSVLSFDIETDPQARTLLSIALVGCGAAEVLLFTPKDLEAPDEAVAVDSQEELIESFARRVRELDPDVLTGWNIVEFDFPVLMRRAEALGVPLDLGRGRGAVRRRRGSSRQQSSQVSVPGRAVLDGLALLHGAFIRMEEYSLDAVAREVLGEGKTVTGRQRAHEILRMFRERRSEFVDYNLTDARLVVQILEELDLVELAVERSRLTGLPPHRVASSIAAFDFLYISELRRRDLVAPSVDSSRSAEETGGGAVLEPVSGLFHNVVVLDFKSLYPSLIRTFQIDPLGFVEHPEPGADLIRAPNGAHFERQPGILPGLLDELFPRRQRAQQEGDAIAAYAIKILMNSFFGVLGTPLCRFYNPAIANAITSFGREILLWARRRIELEGLRVLYGDTDSLFVDTERDDEREAHRLGRELCELLDRELASHIEAIWRTESRLTLELDTVYLRLFLPHVRHGTRGARKRYAGLVRDGDETRVVFTGLEAVRRDWTELARRTQRELFERLFHDEPVEEFVRRRVARLRDGELDEMLIYRKGLRKDLDDYTSTTPPHVVAARKMSEDPGRRVAYVMTVAGPEPARERANSYDYEHYVDKQIRPVTEPVLDLLGLDFAKVIGDDVQLDLF